MIIFFAISSSPTHSLTFSSLPPPTSPLCVSAKASLINNIYHYVEAKGESVIDYFFEKEIIFLPWPGYISLVSRRLRTKAAQFPQKDSTTNQMMLWGIGAITPVQAIFLQSLKLSAHTAVLDEKQTQKAPLSLLKLNNSEKLCEKGK